METPKEFLEGFDPQIKELGYDNYSYTPHQVIERLEAYRKQIVKGAENKKSVKESKEYIDDARKKWLQGRRLESFKMVSLATGMNLKDSRKWCENNFV
jgi:hypothetical protein